uniref:Uncharacterized protein n=1 Tax=Cucumis melo TaxID=3656 RepID=A0A9I9E8R1_CUCME
MEMNLMGLNQASNYNLRRKDLHRSLEGKKLTPKNPSDGHVWTGNGGCRGCLLPRAHTVPSISQSGAGNVGL